MTKRATALPDLAKARVLVVGDVMLDRYWYGEVERISPEAPVPVVKVQRTEERPGGAANVALNSAALGAQVALLSVVGADEAGASLERLIAAKGISTSLHRDEKLATTVKLRVIGRNQQLLRADFETAPSHEVLAGKLVEFEAMLEHCDALVLSDYGKGGLAHIARMIELARARKRIVLVDPKGDDYSKYHGATVITPNRAELREVVGQWKNDADFARRAEALRAELALAALLVTRGEDGMALFEEGGMREESAQAREVYDVTGAGDTVIGTLAVLLAAGATMHEAVRVANHAAGIAVGKFGTAVVHPDELVSDLEASTGRTRA
ncbi:MAG: D-glycero-beta-D-manno-heptose-7-phosphate kinase [Burkholderiales bacterium]